MPQYGDLVCIASVNGKRKMHRILEKEDWHTQHGVSEYPLELNVHNYLI